MELIDIAHKVGKLEEGVEFLKNNSIASNKKLDKILTQHHVQRGKQTVITSILAFIGGMFGSSVTN